MSNNTLGIEKGDVVALKEIEVCKAYEYGFYVDLGDSKGLAFINNRLYDRTISRKHKPNQPFSVLSTSQEARARAEHIVIHAEHDKSDENLFIMLRGGEIRRMADIQWGSIGDSVYPVYQVIWKGRLTDAL